MPDHAIAGIHKYPCTHEIPFSLYMLPTPVYPNWGACDNRKLRDRAKELGDNLPQLLGLRSSSQMTTTHFVT